MPHRPTTTAPRHAILSLAIAAAWVVASPFALPSTAQAHEFGPRTYDWNADQPTLRRRTCSGARNMVKRSLRDQARRHCRTEHDSGSNALRRTSFSKGTCTKVNAPGQGSSARITGARYTATCR